MKPLRSQLDIHQAGSHANHFGPDSFLKLLLRVESIQTSLLGFIMNSMVSRTARQHQSDAAVATSHRINSINRHTPNIEFEIKLFNHIRWCDVIYNPTQLTSKLLEYLNLFPPSLRIEIISTLPSLVTERNKESLVDSLLQSVESSTGMI